MVIRCLTIYCSTDNRITFFHFGTWLTADGWHGTPCFWSSLLTKFTAWNSLLLELPAWWLAAHGASALMASYQFLLMELPVLMVPSSWSFLHWWLPAHEASSIDGFPFIKLSALIALCSCSINFLHWWIPAHDTSCIVGLGSSVG